MTLTEFNSAPPCGWGQFRDITASFAVKLKGQKLYFFAYQAECHGGITGTEFHGIGCVSTEPSTSVIFDRHLRHARHCDISAEMKRISEMDEAGLADFFRSVDRLRFNPMTAAGGAKKLAAYVKRSSAFNFVTHDLQGDQLVLAKDWDRMILCRVREGPGDSRGCPSWFTPRVYNELSLRWGHIAHTNRQGFYYAQIAPPENFSRIVSQAQRMRTTYGLPVRTSPETEELYRVLQEIAVFHARRVARMKS